MQRTAIIFVPAFQLKYFIKGSELPNPTNILSELDYKKVAYIWCTWLIKRQKSRDINLKLKKHITPAKEAHKKQQKIFHA